MSAYSKSMFEKDLRKLKSLINNYNKMNGGGYDVSPQPLAKGIHATTVVGYVDDCAPTLSTLASEAKTGGGMLTGSVQALCKILAPMGSTEAMEFLLEKMKDTKTNNEFFQSMGTKSS